MFHSVFAVCYIKVQNIRAKASRKQTSNDISIMGRNKYLLPLINS